VAKFTLDIQSRDQGCQMVYFQTKNPNLSPFWRALDWKIWIYFMAIWNILRTSWIFYDHLVHFVFVLCSFGTIFPVLISCTEKNLATLQPIVSRYLLWPWADFVIPVFWLGAIGSKINRTHFFQDGWIKFPSKARAQNFI
jgi:hypothetical protein